MDISPLFQQEISAVDPAKTLVFVVSPSTHNEFEWSYSGLTITGGTELACEYGASELMEEMGFRWYTSSDWGTVRPATIPTGLTRAKTTFWFPNNSVWLAYGHAWWDVLPASASTPTLADRAALVASQARWATLNGVNLSAHPTGHRWTGVISNHLDFFRAHPSMIVGGLNSLPPIGNAATAKYDLEPGHMSAADYDLCVHINAAHLLYEGRLVTSPRSAIEITWTDWKRTHFDAADGDLNQSDWFYPFTKAVGDKMRAGTAAIDTIPAQAGELNAEVGVYAYAGHRLPPATSYAPSVYTYIALAFNQTDLSYLELVEGHGAKTDKTFLREYWDTQSWSNGQPFVNSRAKQGYFEDPDWYDAFHAAGAAGISAEFNANWFVNIVMCRSGIRKCKTGIGVYDTALDDIMSKLFISPITSLEDPKVRELYELWGNQRNNFNRYNMRVSCDIIAGMDDGWYKTLFEQYMVICKKRLYLPPQILRADNTNWPDPKPGDLYPDAFTSYAANLVGTRMAEPMHSYAQVSRDCNENVRNNYPALWMSRRFTSQSGVPTYTTDPDWASNPQVPTHAEFIAAHAQLLADTPHDTDLDSEDLVLVRGVVSTTAGALVQPDAPHFYTLGAAPYAFVGPGTVIFTEALSGAPILGGDVIMQTYGHGVHYFIQPFGNWLVSNQGGELFVDTFGGVRKDAHTGSGSHWLYIPTRAAGAVHMEAAVRWTFWDKDDAGNVYRLDLAPQSHSAYVDPKDLGPGQVLVDNINTRDSINNTGANRWLSKKSSVVLVPRVIAEEDFPNRARVAVAA